MAVCTPAAVSGKEPLAFPTSQNDNMSAVGVPASTIVAIVCFVASKIGTIAVLKSTPVTEATLSVKPLPLLSVAERMFVAVRYLSTVSPFGN